MNDITMPQLLQQITNKYPNIAAQYSKNEQGDFNPLLHLPRRLVRKGQRQKLRLRNPAFQHVRNPKCNHARLPVPP